MGLNNGWLVVRVGKGPTPSPKLEEVQIENAVVRRRSITGGAGNFARGRVRDDAYYD